MAKLKLTPKETLALGARIKAVRKAMGYEKSAAFQKDLGFSATVYYQWELGRRKPDEDALKKISKKCHVNYEWLKTGKSNPLEGIKIESNKAKEQEAIISYELLTNKLAEKRKPIPGKLQKSIIQYAEAGKTAASSQGETYIYIKEALMAEILKELINVFEKSGKKLDAAKLAKFASQVYADIVSSEQDVKLQKHLVRPMANAYKRFV